MSRLNNHDQSRLFTQTETQSSQLVRRGIWAIFLSVAMMVLLVGISSSVALFLSFSAVVSLGTQDFAKVKTQTDASQQFLQPARIIAGQLGDVQFWQKSLELMKQSAIVLETTRQFIPEFVAFDSAARMRAASLTSQLAQLIPIAESWEDALARAPIGKRILQTAIYQKYPSLAFLLKNHNLRQSLRDLQLLTDTLLTGQQRWIILLQNSEELRPTGGFIGSYVLVEVDNGALQTLKVHDIYEPDGQFKEFIEAPSGVKEYLSGGAGMRLPNANWHPDFPVAAQEMLPFFGIAKTERVDGIIALNLNVVENILNILGPIQLPDYQQTVTADTLAEQARADRDQFFPGSQQKKQFLQTLLTQLKLKLQDSSADQKKQILTSVFSAFILKDIQVFSHDTALQQLFKRIDITGEIPMLQHDDLFISLVEANVGINKANKKISREVELAHTPAQTKITVIIHNDNDQLSSTSSDTLLERERNYINYQRILVQPDFSVAGIQINDQPVTNWNDQLIQTSQGQNLRQIGFLLPVKLRTTSRFTITFNNNSNSAQFPKRLILQKQSGIPPVPYQLNIDGYQKFLLLEKDLVQPFY